MLRIVVAESQGFSSAAVCLLRQHCEVLLGDLDRCQLLAEIGDADVLWVRLRHSIDAEVIAAAPRLKVIVTPTTGLNHIDIEEAERRDIQVLSLRGETRFLRDIRGTAEHTVGLALALIRQTPAAVWHVAEGRWNRDQFVGRELYAKTAGIVGYGRLGQIVARYLRAFDMSVLAADPYQDECSIEPGVTLVSLPDLLREADIVSLHVSLTSQTRGFFGPEQFASMKRESWFVNTARGELVDEAALLDALRSGHLQGAALDVLCDEQQGCVNANPLVRNARNNNNLLITPHIGGCTLESMEKTEQFMVEKLRRYLLCPRSFPYVG